MSSKAPQRSRADIEKEQRRAESTDLAPTDVSNLLKRARGLLDDGNPVEARSLLSRVLGRDLDSSKLRLNPSESEALQFLLNKTADRLLFSPSVVPGDILVARYRVASGDMLSVLGNRNKVPYALIKRINGFRRDTDLRADSRIKVVRGPFHAVIGKAAYRLGVYALDPTGRRIYVCSYPVGLGADDSTPTGRWLVARGKKENPDWRNPVTNKYYRANDPENPIGEHWIPLRGTDRNTRPLDGYGIHGTIEPKSIGSQSSMGCVRLLPPHVELIYDMLAVGHSTVEIRP